MTQTSSMTPESSAGVPFFPTGRTMLLYGKTALLRISDSWRGTASVRHGASTTWDRVGGVSVSCDGNVWRAFLWEHGSMVDLNSLVPPASPLSLVYAVGINDRGEIAGKGVLQGVSTAPPDQDTMSRAFVLIPCDEEHPNIEGCDYSSLDETSTSPVHAARSGQLTAGKTNLSALSPSQVIMQLRSRGANKHGRFSSLHPN